MGIPIFGNQRRPVDFRSLQTFEALLTKGTELKLSSPDEKQNNTNITEWFKSIASNLELLGLDTVFRVPTAGWTKEIYIAKDWGQAMRSFVEPWVNQLVSTGVVDSRTGVVAPVCPYDTANLHYSGLYILHSVTSQYRQELKHYLGGRPTGPLLLCHLLQNRLALVQSKQRKLIKELEELNITQQPGANVRLFTLKVQRKIEGIVQTAPTC